MKRFYIPMLACILFCQLNVAAQGMKVTTGTNVKLTNGALNVVLANGSNLENNSAIQNSNITIKATGMGSSQIKGTGALGVGSILVNKTAGQTITLMKDVSVANNVTFTSGLLDLNGNNIILADTALLVNESETSKVIGPTGGSVQVTSILDAPLAENPGNLGLIITSGANLGSTTIKRSNNAYSNLGGNNSILRSFTVTPTNDTGLDAFIRMYYKDAELNGLDENTLDFYASANGGATWSNLGATSRNTTQNFVNINGIQSLSMLSLSVPTNPLPLTLTYIEARCDRNRALVEWRVANPQSVLYFRMMKSNDGKSWESAADHVNVVNDPNYLYSFTDAKPPAAFYKLEGRDVDGKVFYSTIQSVNCGTGNASFQLVENPVYNALHIAINSKQDQQITVQVFDLQGRKVSSQSFEISKGISQIDADAGRLTSGIYQLSISDQPEILWRTKFVKQ